MPTQMGAVIAKFCRWVQSRRRKVIHWIDQPSPLQQAFLRIAALEREFRELNAHMSGLALMVQTLEISQKSQSRTLGSTSLSLPCMRFEGFDEPQDIDENEIGQNRHTSIGMRDSAALVHDSTDLLNCDTETENTPLPSPVPDHEPLRKPIKHDDDQVSCYMDDSACISTNPNFTRSLNHSNPSIHSIHSAASSTPGTPATPSHFSDYDLADDFDDFYEPDK
jgi:hypothetical protein